MEKELLSVQEDKKYDNNPALLRRVKLGDREAISELAILNAGLVKSIALRYTGRGVDLDDLVQTGNIGLIRAIKTFDETRGCAFSTYAVPLIFGEIRRFLRDDGMIKVSRETRRLGAILQAEREKLCAGGERAVRISELAARVGVSVEEASDALCATSPIASLSDMVYNSDDSPDIESSLASDEENERNIDRLAIRYAIDKLPDLHKKIVLLRFFRDMPQQKVAQALGVSQVKISREEKKILAFLKNELSD